MVAESEVGVLVSALPDTGIDDRLRPSLRADVLCHSHHPDECGILIAAWMGFRSPLRHGRPLGSCATGGATGGHRIWWTVEAADRAAALSLLPPYVAERTVAIAVREVPIP